MTSLAEHLQKLDDYIIDEKKVVTYKWLSQNLGLHVNETKSLLWRYVENAAPSLRKQLQVTYFVGGQLKGSSGYGFRIVKDEELEKTAEHFESVTSKHIFSVNLCSPLPCLSSLYTVDRISCNPEQRHNTTIICPRATRKYNTREKETSEELMETEHPAAGVEPMDVNIQEARDGGTSSTAVEDSPSPSKKIRLQDTTGAAIRSTSEGPASSRVVAKAVPKANASKASKQKKTTKIFGCTPGRRKQTSLTSFFNKS